MSCEDSHRRVRVLLLDPFRKGTRMIELPAADRIESHALDSVMRLAAARHSYRDNVRIKMQELDQPSYHILTWSFDRVMRIPGFTTNMSGTVLGLAVVCKFQVAPRGSSFV